MKHLSPLIAIFFSCCLFLVGASVVDAKIVCVIDGDIYVMDDDGTNRRRLTKTTEPINNVAPRWSPDGERIVFVRYMDQNNQKSSELFIMNADGTNVQRLTDNNVDDDSPSWSPDGKKIAFSSGRSGNWEVHVIDLATQDVTQLTGFEDVKGEVPTGSTVPDWSPDGAQIVYEKFTEFGKDIYVMSANGEDQRPLLRDLGPGKNRLRFFPRWSTDGRRIVFDDCTWPQGGKLRCRLRIATLDGKSHEVKGLYKNHGDNLLVGIMCWMRTDKSLLLDIQLLDKPNPNYDIYRYDLNTQKLIRLTDGEVDEHSADWIEGALPVVPKDKKKSCGER
ncbi:hypothetical protein C6501_01530 [Candidatus Poribacteria bacterium]|nr:MAG: hypothetical protein C6501_01530 [Candidatus Poribacteria bacterium]